MAACHVCGKRSRTAKRCGRCHSAYYCDVACQRKAWPEHKLTCRPPAISTAAATEQERERERELKTFGLASTTDQLRLQSEAIRSGKLYFHYLNPRNDRNVETHGNDTHQVMRRNKHVIRLEKLMNVDRPATYMHACTTYTGAYGQCWKDCVNMVNARGGEVGYGWSLYEGRYMVEAEFHCVWIPPGENKLFNLTPSYDGIVHDGFFMFETGGAVGAEMLRTMKIPASRIMWK